MYIHEICIIQWLGCMLSQKSNVIPMSVFSRRFFCCNRKKIIISWIFIIHFAYFMNFYLDLNNIFACFMFYRWCPLLISLSLSSIVVIGGSLSLRLSLSSSLIWVGSSFHSSQFAVAKSSSLFSYQGSHFIWCPLNPRPNFLTARIPSLRCPLNWSTLWSDIFKHGLLSILLPINLPITFSWCKVFPLTLPSVSIQYNNQRLNLLHFSFVSHNSVKLSQPNTCCHDNITQIYLIMHPRPPGRHIGIDG